MANIIHLCDPLENIKLVIEYGEKDGAWVVFSVKRECEEGLVDITDQFEEYSPDRQYLYPGDFLCGRSLKLKEEAALANQFTQLVLNPNELEREHGAFGSILFPRVMPLKRYVRAEKIPVVPNHSPRDLNPAYNELAAKLKAHDDHFQKRGIRRKAKRAFLNETRPEGLSKAVPGLTVLTELTDNKKTSAEYNSHNTNDYLEASAFHRWQPTRHHILPRHFGRLVRENSELENTRVMEIWSQNYATRLRHPLRYKGRSKSSSVSEALRYAKKTKDVSITDQKPDTLLEFLTVSAPGKRSLIGTIAEKRTHKWRVGNTSFGFDKLFKDFPSLEKHREYLRLHAWVEQYCESLEKVVMNRELGVAKAAAIRAALKVATEATIKYPKLRSSLYNFLIYREPYRLEPSILDLIQSGRTDFGLPAQGDEQDKNVKPSALTHGYDMLCRDFKQLKLLKWIKDYCKRLKMPHSGKTGQQKATLIQAAVERANHYLSQHEESLSPEEFLKQRVDGKESILAAIMRKRKGFNMNDEQSRGYKRMCKDLKLNMKELENSDIEMTSHLDDADPDTDTYSI